MGMVRGQIGAAAGAGSNTQMMGAFVADSTVSSFVRQGGAGSEDWFWSRDFLDFFGFGFGRSLTNLHYITRDTTSQSGTNGNLLFSRRCR